MLSIDDCPRHRLDSTVHRFNLTRSGAIPGALAGLLAVAVMLLLGRLWDAPVPPQLLADRITAALPVETFGSILGSLESAAKPLLFIVLLLGQVAVGALLTALAEPYLRRGGDPSWVFLGLLAIVFGLLALVIAPLGGIGVAGIDAPEGATLAIVAFFAVALSYAAPAVSWLSSDAGRSTDTPDEGRRRLIRVAAVSVPALLAAGYIGRFLVGLGSGSQASNGRESTASGLPPALTPTEDFYVVSKNFVDPNVTLDNWALQVDGLVDRPRSYRYDELRALPATTKTTTLECISNEVGGSYISTGEWTGVLLRDLLDEAGVRPEVVDVVLHAADGYADSFPLAAAMDPDTIVVYDLNGAPLTRDHGFPLRVIVPGIFGMKNVKWLERISLVDEDFKGYWQDRGWSDLATVVTMSRIDQPADGASVLAGAQTTIGGVAFAGDRGIRKVEVSLDDGVSWREAAIEPPLSPLTWVRWTLPWTPEDRGSAWSTSLTVRAWDGAGAVQTDDESPPLPDGATGYHRIGVKVRAAGDTA